MNALDRTTVEGRELLALLSKQLCLPQHCSFGPLGAKLQPIDLDSDELFSGHAAFSLPCDYGCAAARGQQVLGRADLVHTFRLKRSVADPLNAALADWSLEKERRARAPRDGDEKERNVSKSNWGGFQSCEEVFLDRHDSPDRYAAMACCRELHRLISAAMDILCKHDTARPTAAGELCQGVAWVNVNRPGRFCRFAPSPPALSS